MQFYLAPLEGVTGYIVRNAFAHHFPYIDKYFTPFFPAAKRMNKKIIRDLIPENNPGIKLVPQLMVNDAKDMEMMGKQLKDMGFESVNLNCGCPSGTVVSKKKGAGILGDPVALDRFLDETFRVGPLKISIKTRIGVEFPSEWEDICKVYEKYPLEELIIHPRVRTDFYKNTPNMEAFAYAVDRLPMPLCYNGDINTVEDYQAFTERFPQTDRMMIGRGLLANPGLVGEILGHDRADKKQIKAFHDEIVNGYTEIFSGDKDVVGHMKEIWFYLIRFFPDKARCLKQIQKCQSMPEYRLIVQQILS